MSNKYCQALAELRNKPAHELKEVGDQWRTPDNIFWGINTRWRMTGQNVLWSLKVLPLVIPHTAAPVSMRGNTSPACVTS